MDSSKAEVMSSTSFPIALGTFCFLRLSERRVFSALSDSYTSDVPSFIHDWVQHSHDGNEDPFCRVFISVVQDTLADLTERDQQFLACLLICGVFSHPNEALADVLRVCRLLQRNVRTLLSSLYLSSPVAATEVNATVPDARTVPTGSSRCFRWSGERPIPSKEGLHSVDNTDAKCFERKSPHSVFHENGRLACLSFTHPESTALSQLIKLSARMASEHKYLRGCCVRQLDNCADRELLVLAAKRSRVQVFFVQRKAARELVESLMLQGIVCVDRLGTAVVDQFGSTLDWRVYESIGDWMLTCREGTRPQSWKYWLSTKSTRKGLQITIHPRNVRHTLDSADVAPSKTDFCTTRAATVDLGENTTQLCNSIDEELLLAWERSFLYLFHTGLATILLKKSCTVGNADTVRRVLEGDALEAAVNAVILLCRCRL